MKSSPSFEPMEERLMLAADLAIGIAGYAALATSGTSQYAYQPGGAFQVQLTIENIGDTETAGFPYQDADDDGVQDNLGYFYTVVGLSRDLIRGNSDDIICFSQANNGLMAGDVIGATPVLDANDVEIYTTINGVWVAAMNGGFVTAHIPANTPLGSYFLFAEVDATNLITEGNEFNNVAWWVPHAFLDEGDPADPTDDFFSWDPFTAAPDIHVDIPDLTMASISGPAGAVLPAAVPRGGSLHMRVGLQNVNNGPAGGYWYEVRLSTDGVCSNNDITIARTWVDSDTAFEYNYAQNPVGGRAQQPTFLDTIWAVIPASTPLGTYRILAMADVDGQVTEVNEANNAGQYLATIQVTGAPVQVTVLPLTPPAPPGAPQAPAGITDQARELSWSAVGESEDVQMWALGPQGWKKVGGVVSGKNGSVSWEDSTGVYGFAAEVAGNQMQSMVAAADLAVVAVSPSPVVAPVANGIVIDLLRPAAGETLSLASPMEITWNAVLPAGLDLDVVVWARGETTDWFPVSVRLAAATESYTWDLPNSGLDAGRYLISLHWINGSTLGASTTADWVLLA